MKKKFFALMMAMVMVLSLAACGGSDEADSNSGDSAGGESSGSSAFKVGVIGPLTGGAAIYGTCVANSAQIAVDEINALGGDIQFELMTEDDVNDAETSVNAYNALMDDGMQILVGTVTTQPALSVVPLSYEDRVFTLTPSASGDDVISINDNDNVFQICFTDSNQGSRSAQYIDENFDSPKIAIIYKNDDQYSIGIRDNFKAEADSRGMDIVYEGTFTEASQTDVKNWVVCADHVREHSGALNASTTDNTYIRTGPVTTKGSVQRTLSIQGDRYVGDAFQDFLLSHKIAFGSGQSVVVPYVYFSLRTGKGEKGEGALILTSDVGGSAGANATFAADFKGIGTPAEFDYNTAVAG